MDKPRLYDIGDAAKHLGVAPSALRYWEGQGLIRSGRNRANDYRQYTLHDLIEASEIAFYRRLGVSVRELESYHAFSVQGLDDALARTEHDIERRISELEATQVRLARQRALNSQAEKLRQEGLRPERPGIGCLHAIDYDVPGSWKALVSEPWRYGILIDAARPDTVLEAAVDSPALGGEPLWQRTLADTGAACRSCLLKVSPTDSRSNAHVLIAKAAGEGIRPRLIIGAYLITASDDAGRWDHYHAWIVGGPHPAPPPGAPH